LLDLVEEPFVLQVKVYDAENKLTENIGLVAA
jgi:hypothetical protein